MTTRPPGPAAPRGEGPNDDPVTAVGERLSARGRAHEVRDGLLVLDSGVAQRVEDLAYAYGRERASGARPDEAAERVVQALDDRERHLRADGGTGHVRLRVTHPDELDPAYTLPGPAGLIVYPVLDEPDTATRLGAAQVEARGGLEPVCVAAMGPTLAEPVRIEAASAGQWLPGWRVTGDIYTASRLLDVGALLREVGADPSARHLVVAPSSREVWVFPVTGDPRAPMWARRHAERAYAESRGRLSRAVYAWDGARLTELEGDQPGSSDIGP
ncbi:hypothetical protein [Mariniluteicoccus flavus]